ncbi:MAG TPA: hypothetical protein VK172_10365 [Lentimicrobium sp.]|nr:hypothetical protein [Lentimicrobium sp.]
MAKKYDNTIWKPVTDLSELERGDVICNLGSGNSYVVDANYGDTVTAVDTVQVSNPIEWVVMRKAEINKPKSKAKSK